MGPVFPLFDVFHPAFPLSTTAWSTPKDDIGEAVVARDMSERCEFLVFHSCQKGVLWAHKAVDLAPHPVVALVYQVGNAEKFPRALGFESLDLFLRVSKQGLCFTAIEKDGVAKSLVHFEVACEAAGVPSPDTV